MTKIFIITLSKKFSIFIFLTAILTASLISFSFYINNNALSALNDYADAEIQDQPKENRRGKLAIIIDDFGQNRDGVKEMMSINRRLTFAVMPFLQFSQSDARKAREKGYEVIVHLPMEATSGKLSWVGPRPILACMESNKVEQIVLDAFEDVPYAAGANIHMGSKASSSERVMMRILEVIKDKNVYFVDSRTCLKPITKKLADEIGAVCFDRNVFLDGGRSKRQILKQLEKAGDVALQKGCAIAIGHVGTEGGKVTAEAIIEMLPEFDRRNIELVFVSDLENEVKY